MRGLHQLIGLMVNEGATGAIHVTSGEFTRAAIEAAARGGHVRLVDGDDLRRMLGDVAEAVDISTDTAGPLQDDAWYNLSAPATHRLAATVGERLLSAAEDRIRHGSGGQRRRSTGRLLPMG